MYISSSHNTIHVYPRIYLAHWADVNHEKTIHTGVCMLTIVSQSSRPSSWIGCNTHAHTLTHHLTVLYILCINHPRDAQLSPYMFRVCVSWVYIMCLYTAVYTCVAHEPWNHEHTYVVHTFVHCSPPHGYVWLHFSCARRYWVCLFVTDYTKWVPVTMRIWLVIIVYISLRVYFRVVNTFL